LKRVSKDEANMWASWFETQRLARLLTTRVEADLCGYTPKKKARAKRALNSTVVGNPDQADLV
jgi:hypothetical protein